MSSTTASRLKHALTLIAAATALTGFAAPATDPVDTASMDRTVAPGDDFYAFANGGWIKATTIPADRNWIGVPMLMQDVASDRVRGLIEQSMAKPGDKLGDLYASFLDEPAIAARGIEPVRLWLNQIDSATDHDGIATAMGGLARYDIGGIFRIGIAEDDGVPGQSIVTLGQGGLGLPNRDLYSGGDARSVKLRAAYLTYLVTMLTLAGEPNPEPRADAVLAFETALAVVHWSAVESRNSTKTYNRTTLDALEATAPGFSWAGYIAALGLSGQKTFIVAQPSALTGEAAIFAKTPVPVLQDYLRLRMLTSYSRYMAPAFEQARFTMFGTAITGATEPLPRWRRGVQVTTNLLGDAVGQAYVAHYFPPAAERQTHALFANMIAALDAKLAGALWMTPETRRRARAKLARTRLKIGHPDKWIDYGPVEIRRDDLVGNVARASAFQFARLVERLDRPVDRSEWVSPVTVPNAFASASANEIIFPAAYLQAPMFDAAGDPAVNYARLGATIGHELSHLFDDQGRKFDASGKLGDWWSASDEAAFTAREKALIAQYDAYEPLPGIHINGALTVGENIADLAGLEVALAAFHRLPASARRTIGGYTADQRFFIAWAQAWRSKYRDDALRTQLASDAHAPGRERSWTVRNMDGWYAAFGVSPKAALYLSPDRRIRFW